MRQPCPLLWRRGFVLASRFVAGRVRQQTQFFAKLDNFGQQLLAAILPLEVGHAVLLRGSLGGGMKGEQIEQQTGRDDLRLPTAKLGQTLAEKIFQQDAAAAQFSIERGVKARCSRLPAIRLFPHLRQQNLQDRGNGRDGVLAEIAGDLFRQPRFDDQVVLCAQPLGRRWPAHHFDDSNFVQPFQRHVSQIQIAPA